VRRKLLQELFIIKTKRYFHSVLFMLINIIICSRKIVSAMTSWFYLFVFVLYRPAFNQRHYVVSRTNSNKTSYHPVVPNFRSIFVCIHFVVLSFGGPMLLVGKQKGHPNCKNFKVKIPTN